MHKRIFILLILVSFSIITLSQNIQPVILTHKPSTASQKKLAEEIEQNKSLLKLLDTKKAGIDSSADKETYQQLDMMIKSLEKKNKKIEEKKTDISELINFFGSTVVGAGTDFLSTITSSGQLNAVINPFGKTFFGLGANLLYANPDNSENKDTVGLSSLVFPETGKFGFLGSLYQKIKLGGGDYTTDIGNDYKAHYIIPQFSFAYRRVTIDSPSVAFKVLNYNIGLKYQLEAISKNGDAIGFSLMPYYHYFNVPNEDVSKFNQIMNDSIFAKSNKGANISALGLKTLLQYNNFVFFFDIRYQKDPHKFSDDNLLKGTLVNIGFSTLFNISLKKKDSQD